MSPPNPPALFSGARMNYTTESGRKYPVTVQEILPDGVVVKGRSFKGKVPKKRLSL